MKLEVKENMYVRNCYGRIAKIEYIEDNTAYCDNWLYQSYEDYITFINLNDEEDKNEILKASYNIIDILECGDYLNGFKVSEIERYDTNTIIKIGNSTFNVLEGEKIYTPSYDNNNGYEKIEKLKSIVTHEQMEQMAYKVGD